jgi:DNA-binding NarL/FixJ family response regulator
MRGAPPGGGTASDRAELTEIVSANVVDVVIVSDVRLLREALADNLARFDHVRVAGVSTHDGAVSAIASAPGAIVLIDLNTPHVLSLVRSARDQRPESRFVAFAVSDCDESIISCAEAGVRGYVCQDGSVDDIVSALQSAVRDELHTSPHVAAALFRRLATIANGDEATVHTLTRRQRQIAACIDRGLSNKEIARELGIQLATVKNHVHGLLAKLGAAGRGEAAARLRQEPPGLR